jgi:hypothetical protein
MLRSTRLVKQKSQQTSPTQTDAGDGKTASKKIALDIVNGLFDDVA